MKTSSVSLCFLTATLFAAPAFAQAGAPAATPPPPLSAGEPSDEFRGRGHPPRHWRKMMRMRRAHLRQAVLHRFDQDGDHRLNEAERAAARKAGREMRDRFQEGRRQMLERFDANHDGRLDENERKGLRDAWQEFVKQRPVLAPAPAAPTGN